MEITEEIPRRILKLLEHGLTRGVGTPVPGQMCVEAVVCYAMGQAHGDEPACVSPALRALKIHLNDAGWSSNKARADGLRRIALAQLGSAGALDEIEFAQRVAKLAQEVAAGAAYAAYVTARSAAAAAAVNAAAAAAAASTPPPPPPPPPYAAAGAAIACAAAAPPLACAAADKVLGDFAEAVVQILIDMKAPGCQWLYLTETP